MLKVNIFVLIGFVVYFFYIFINFKKFSLSYHIILFTFLVYTFTLIGITLFPIPIQPQAIEMLREIHITNNYIPFKSIISNIVEATHWIVWFKIIIGNILLFMPLGFYLPLIVKKHVNVWKVIIIGFCVSLCIEVMQMFISLLVNCRYKSFDVDDLFLNIAGTVLGFIIFKFLYYVLQNCLKWDINRYIEFEKS